MGWFRTRCRWWEIALLLFATFVLFRPNYFMDLLYAPYRELPAREIASVAEQTPPEYSLVMLIEGMNVEGDEVRKTVGVQLGSEGEGRKRLAEAGLTLSTLGDEVRITGVRFGSRAKRAGIEQGFHQYGYCAPGHTQPLRDGRARNSSHPETRRPRHGDAVSPRQLQLPHRYPHPATRRRRSAEK